MPALRYLNAVTITLLACQLGYGTFLAQTQKSTPEVVPSVSKNPGSKNDQASNQKQLEPVPMPSPGFKQVQSDPKQGSANKANDDIEANGKIADYTSALARYTAALVVVGLLQFLALIGQARILNRSIREMQDATRATREAVSAYRGYSDIAKHTAEATRQSADAATSSARLAEKALHLTERADILMEHIDLATPGMPSGRAFGPDTVLTMVFKNFGRTRADQVVPRFTVRVPDGEPIPEPLKIPTVLGAGDTLHLPFPAMRKCVTQETCKRILAGQVRFSFGGEITYKDVFGFQHRTKCGGTYRHDPVGFDVDENEAD